MEKMEDWCEKYLKEYFDDEEYKLAWVYLESLGEAGAHLAMKTVNPLRILASKGANTSELLRLFAELLPNTEENSAIWGREFPIPLFLVNEIFALVFLAVAVQFKYLSDWQGFGFGILSDDNADRRFNSVIRSNQARWEALIKEEPAQE